MEFKKLSIGAMSLLLASGVQAKTHSSFSKTTSASEKAKITTLAQAADVAKQHVKELSAAQQKSGLVFAKATSTLKSRLVGYAYRDMTAAGLLMDTVKLFYGSPDRGSDMKTYEFKSDSMLNWTYNDTTSALELMYKQTQNFDGANNITTAINQGWSKYSSSYYNDSRTTNTYNSSNKLTEAIDESWDGSAWQKMSRTVNVYDAAQNKIADSSFDWDGASWVANSATLYYYNTMGKEDSSRMFFPLFGTSLDEIVRIYNTYDASGYLTKSLIRVVDDFVTMSFGDYARVNYTNNAAGYATKALVEAWDATASTWENDNQTINSYDAANNLLSDVHYMWDGASFVENYKNAFVYNTFNQPTKEEYSNWDGTSWQLGDRYNYYYEEHTSSIKTINEQISTKIFPVPAQNNINIEGALKQAQSLQISLTDLQGRVLIMQHLANKSVLSETISVAAIPAGNYFINIIGEQGVKIVHKVTIVH